MKNSSSAISPEINPDDYVILEPGRLIVTHLRDNTLLSVVRDESVSVDSELYQPVIPLTKGLDVFFHMIDSGTEVTIYRAAA